MLNVANQSQAIGLIQREIYQEDFRMRGVNHLLQVLGANFQTLGFRVAAVNDCRDPAICAHLFDTQALIQFAWKRGQRYRFHFKYFRYSADFAAEPKK
jgi:hypothetical protein